MSQKYKSVTRILPLEVASYFSPTHSSSLNAFSGGHLRSNNYSPPPPPSAVRTATPERHFSLPISGINHV